MAFEDALADALRAVRPVIPVTLDAPLGRAAFVGSGDSLASAQIAAAFGHRAMSSGDITWTGRVPVGCDTVVGISHSGTSGATVRALRLARSQGLRTVAITSDADAPLAAAADEVQLVPTLQVDELVPVVYADVHEALYPVARRSLWAHLRKLADDGRATVDDPDDIDAARWRPSPSPDS